MHIRRDLRVRFLRVRGEHFRRWVSLEERCERGWECLESREGRFLVGSGEGVTNDGEV